MKTVGIYGASGYMGGEIVRILREHPLFEISWIVSRGNEPISHIHKNFYGTDLDFIQPGEETDVDAVVYSLPSGIVMKEAQKWLDKGTKVIDLGADFRLQDIDLWESTYNKAHSSPHLVKRAAYGIPEVYREQIKATNLVANPGCYASAMIFAFMPLIGTGILDESKLIVDGLSGTVGAGAGLDVPLHHPEMQSNILPYNVVHHRHTTEVEQALGLKTDEKVAVHFTAHHVPIGRGILCTCHGFLKQKLSRKDLLERFLAYYADEPFIKVMNIDHDIEAKWQFKPYPAVSVTSGTNFCHIGLDVDEERGRVVIFSALDSIGKGGAHAGVQNLNILFGFDEKTGLERVGMHPY